MKKVLALLLTVLFLLPVLASAEEPVIDAETVMDFNRESPVTDWVGNWVLAAAYIGEDWAEENDVETTGLLTVPENAVTMTVEALLDASATGSDAGVMVDQASYLHAHVYDMDAKITFPAEITEEEAGLRLPWDGWQYTVRGENDGDFNMGVGKLSKVSAEDKSLYFCQVTGVESEAISDENMKYVGMNTADQLIVMYSDDNMVKKDGDVAFAYIFVRAAE